MKPLDIDGNELKVGDDVEVAVPIATWNQAGPLPPVLKVGFRFSVLGFDEDPWFPNGVGALWKIDEVGRHHWIATSKLRLIPRDIKAPTKIEVGIKEGVR